MSNQFDKGIYEQKLHKLQAQNDLLKGEVGTVKNNIEAYKKAVDMLKIENIGLKNLVAKLKEALVKVELDFANMNEKDFGQFQKDFALWLEKTKANVKKEVKNERTSV